MMDQDDVVHRTRTVNPKKLYKERESQREGGRYVPLSHFNILSQSRNIWNQKYPLNDKSHDKM